MKRFRAATIAIAIGAFCMGFAVAKAGQAQVAGSSSPDLHRLPAIMGAIREDATAQHDDWFDDGDFPRSIQSLRVLHYLFPSDYQLLTDLGWMFENVHEEGSAAVVYKEYAHAYPTNAEAAYPEAEFYFRNHLYSKVPQIIEPTLKFRVHPHANSYRILARSYEKMELFMDAKRVWNIYLALDPNDGQAKANLVRVTKKIRSSASLSKARAS